MRVLVVLPKETQFEERLMQILPEQTDVIFMTPGDVKTEDVKDADIILGNVSEMLVKEADHLKFMQLNSAGYDQYLADGILSQNTVMANATGAYGIALAEHMLGELLTLIKKLEQYHDNRKNHAWKDEGGVRTIYGSTTLVIGAGDIGDRFGRLMYAMGSKVIGIRRNVHEKPEYMSFLGTTADIDAWLGEADYVFCAMPSTPETTHMFTLERIDRMKKDAILLNVGRGSLIETSVLVKALREGLLAGACVDVTDPEPLPENSELWDCPNLILTPHVSGGFHARITLERIQDIALKNLKAYLSGEEMVNVISH